MEQLAEASLESKHDWYAIADSEVFGILRSSSEGLDQDEATRRLDAYGPNSLPAKRPPTIWEIILHQLKSPLIYILAFAAAASVAIGEGVDAAFILAVIVLNSALGAYQEFQAEKSAAGLQNLLKISARVRRGGVLKTVPSEVLVPGDVVILESGQKVPADLRLIQEKGLSADESFLTGESMAADKTVAVLPSETEVGDRKNMAFAGGIVASGRGIGMVVETGVRTEVGKIAQVVAESEGGKPPLVVRMERFVKRISILMLIVGTVLALILLAKGEELSEIFFLVIALSVSAIPEGLPVALTVALSIAAKRMSHRNVIVRKLTAVESLGSCTVIASDKTGTLTVNQQTARRVALPDGHEFKISGEGYNGDGKVAPVEKKENIPDSSWDRLKNLSKMVSIANEGSLKLEGEEWHHHGDAMDVAFLAVGYKLGLDPCEIRGNARITHEIPYESERRFSAAFFEEEGVEYVAAKGAVETILKFCSKMECDDGVKELDRKRIESQAEEMAEEGLRVLAVASGEAASAGGRHPEKGERLSGLMFQGLVGFIDPLRHEAVKSVKKCRRAGIKVIMITGDHPATAGAIASDLGIMDQDEVVVTGKDLREAGDPTSPEFDGLVMSSHVFARVSPTQKLEIVDSLIRGGEFVAVTGDGVNDAPALRRANIGVAMGSGTDVAKDVGTMIVVDDNFASIVAGVEEGRFAYDNVRKVIYLLVSTGAAEILMFLAAIIVGLPIPLVAVQLLWLNLVTNGIQDVALAFEGGEPGAMKRKPRSPGESIFNGQMISQTLVSGVTMAIICFGVYAWFVRVQDMDEASARNIALLLMVLLENIHVFNCRSETVSAFRVPIRRNVLLVGGVFVAQGIHILSMQTPFMQRILGVEPVTMLEWLALLGLSSVLLLVMEIFKKVKNKVTE